MIIVPAIFYSIFIYLLDFFHLVVASILQTPVSLPHSRNISVFEGGDTGQVNLSHIAVSLWFGFSFLTFISSVFLLNFQRTKPAKAGKLFRISILLIVLDFVFFAAVELAAWFLPATNLRIAVSRDILSVIERFPFAYLFWPFRQPLLF